MMKATLFRIQVGLCFLAFVSIFMTAESAPAITGVSGTVSHGELVTIAGSGFGARGTYNNNNGTWKNSQFLNFRFKDFEDRQLNSNGFYPQRGGGSWSPSSSELGVLAGGPRNSTGYMRRAYSTVESGGISANVAGAGNQLYTTFKFMLPANTQSGKFFRFYADSPQRNVYLSTGCSGTQVRGYSECNGPTCDAYTEWGSGPAFQPGQWHRVEVWADADSNTFSVSVDGVAAWTKYNWLASSLALNSHTIDYPNMIDSAERGCGIAGSYNFDDIFIDFTRSRVEIGDAATWSATRKKEVQLPVSWANGSIEIRLNAGEFTPGQAVYLYVVDSSGAVNNEGYRLIVGGSAATVAGPRAPTDLRVD